MIPPNLIWQFREFQISEILVKLALLVPRKKEANQIMVSTLPEFQGSKSSHILCFSQRLRQNHEKTSIWCLFGGTWVLLGFFVMAVMVIDLRLRFKTGTLVISDRPREV